MGRHLTKEGFRKRELKQKKDYSPLIEAWAKEKGVFHITIFSYGNWCFTKGISEKTKGFIVREEKTHEVMSLIRKKLKIRSKYFWYLGSHDWGEKRKMHIHVVLKINSRKKVYWESLWGVINEINKQTKRNIQTYLVEPSDRSDLAENQVLYPLKVKDSMVDRFIPRKPFTSPNFDAKKASRLPVEKKKDLHDSVSERERRIAREFLKDYGSKWSHEEAFKSTYLSKAKR